VASTAWAFATLGYHSGVFFGSFCKIVSGLIKEGNEQGIIDICCYAFAILDLTGKYEKEFRQLWATAVGFDSLSVEGSRQLFQVFAFSLARGMEISEPSISCCFLGIKCWCNRNGVGHNPIMFAEGIR
jgi:hypothetical protein